MLFCNGQPARADQLALLGRINYGHFTTLQMSQGSIKGWDLHVERLQHATNYLFATSLDLAQLQAQMRRAGRLSGMAMANVRVTVCSLQLTAQLTPTPPVDVFLHFSPSTPRPLTAVALCTQCHQRMFPQIKHVATFSSYFYQRRARVSGFDDVLFVTETDHVAEGSFWNIGFWDGSGVIWPQAPILAGTCQALFDRGLRSLKIASQVYPLPIRDIRCFRSAFICNALGYRPVRSINDHSFPEDPPMAVLQRALAMAPWQDI